MWHYRLLWVSMAKPAEENAILHGSSESEQPLSEQPYRPARMMLTVISLLAAVGAVTFFTSSAKPHIRGGSVESLARLFAQPRVLATCSHDSRPTGDGVVDDCVDVDVGQSCTAHCGPGYSGTSTSYNCGADQKFTGTVPACTGLKCAMTSVPTTPVGQFVNDCSDKTTSQTCTVQCGSGYTGDTEIYVCTTSSTFSGTQPTCSAQKCTTGLPEGNSITHDCADKTTGQTCTASCAPGHTGTATTLTCGVNAQFTGTTPACTGIPCATNPPTTPLSFGTNSITDCTGKVAGQTCKASCETGFFASSGENQVTVTCGSNQQFEPPSITCTACGTDCHVCSSATQCLSCKNSKYLDADGACVDPCPDGYYGREGDTVTGIGYKCEPCMKDCAKCSGAKVCTQCENSKYLLKLSECVDSCPAGYFPEGLSSVGRECKACDTNCNKCTDTAVCEECKNSKSLYKSGTEAHCVETCPTGMHSSGTGHTGLVCAAGPAPATPAPSATPAPATSGSTAQATNSLCASSIAWGACFSALTSGKQRAEIVALCQLVRQTPPLPAGVSPDVISLNTFFHAATGTEKQGMDHALDSSGHCHA